MYIGYIIGGSHPLFKTVDHIKNDMNCLIIGYDNAIKFYPNANIDNYCLEDNVYFCFNEEESDKERYLRNLNKIGKICFKSFQNGAKKIIIKNLSDIYLNEEELIFYHESEKVITITQNETIYYLNKEFLDFLEVDYTQINLKGKVLSITNNYENINAIFKNSLVDFDHNKIIESYKGFGEIDTYFGYFCLKWLNKFKINFDFENKGYQVWKKAYWVENLLSSIPILINEKIAFEFNEEILEQSKNGYVIQKYNGTNKITGRIFASNSDFSLQTLSKEQRKMIISEPKCYLVEFDYSFFEFEILRQICGFDFVGDPHYYTSELLFGDRENRKKAKEINYSILYGKSLKKIIEEYSNVPNIKEKLKDFIKIFEKVEEKNLKLQKFYEENGYIENYFGRKIKPTEKYKCLNNYVQSTAADYFISKILRVSDLLRSFDPLNRIVLQNHDSLLLNLREEDIELDIAKKIKYEMELPEDNLKAKTSLKFGRNWKEIS